MKKIIYSTYTKAAAAVLFVLAVVSAAIAITWGVGRYTAEKEFVYGFESEFSNSKYFSYMIMNLETKVCDYLTAGDELIQENLEQENINYYININGEIYSNTENENFPKGQFYNFVSRDKYGNIKRDTSLKNYNSFYNLNDVYSNAENGDEIEIKTSVKDSYLKKCEKIWERQEDTVNKTITYGIITLVLGIICFIYLIFVCGKCTDGKNKNLLIDGIWTEIHFAISFIIGFIGVISAVIILGGYADGYFTSTMMYFTLGLISAAVSSVVLCSVLSVVRNLKSGRFIEKTIVLKCIRLIYKKAILLKNTIKVAASAKIGIILIAMLFIYTAVIGLFGILTVANPMFLVLAVILFMLAAFVISNRIKDIEEIKKGVSEIKNGNTAYKIPNPNSEDMQALAQNINEISGGLDEAVAAKVKAEKMKAELITNVSHDLKTPITSIINYTELLKNAEDMPEEARDYIGIIEKKSERLKNLTQDLFDISKAQSGNEEINPEKLDVSLLIEQSVGENNGEITNSGLTFCVNTEKNLYIYADGRKMSRVIGNLISNILKYSMQNTRVFISAYEKNKKAVLEFKNISSYPMDFSGDEIMGRFVRGDKSRTADGNGLGLAIAKSYTELCGGKTEIITDGDMFKAVLTFDEYTAE